ncbi:putative mrna export factor mex67 [Phaeomoniella chlamydospora]|uniref:Putative mrna export factor mex67 n=1 Tax=Phaeomoniella chlamydospora TaxID=158046 RepID=A0A0G2GY28_PHACM|nr:putative mrna export factor mex67 [Phaeomoniella chlamydospora]
MQDPTPNGSFTSNVNDVKLHLTNILKKRYNPSFKILNLSDLGQDADLQQMGILGSETTVKKFFPALMKMADSMFETQAKKRDMVIGVTLAGNSLSDLGLVTTLAATFPDLKALDISNNSFKSIESLKRWQWKFRGLEHIIIAGNEVDQMPEVRPTLLKWFPKLSMINNEQVRSPEELARKLNPIPIQIGSFHDEQGIAAKFLTAFFPLFDNNRDAAVQTFYDAQSNFSLSVNTHAPREQNTDFPTWESYIKKSRNLIKLNHLSARMNRLTTGAESIAQAWSQLPKTRHPSFATQGDMWLVECHHIPRLPDQPGQIVGGVSGLLITTHSSWEEIDVSTNLPKQAISFDRTFVLGPGGSNGIRIISDILCLRAFGGFGAFKAEGVASQNEQPDVPPGFGQPATGKPDEQVKQEAMILGICLKTRLKLDLAKQCLEMNWWDMEKAFLNFQDLKANGQIPEGSYW